MITTRLIPCVFTIGNMVIQSRSFARHQPIGKISAAVQYFSNWDVDEIIIIDIAATKTKRPPNLELIEASTDYATIPVTVGGGINTLEQIRDLLSAGADKVSLNSIARRDPSFVRKASDKFGSQSIVVSVDAKAHNEDWFLYDHQRKEMTNVSVIEFIEDMEAQGAGEILLNSVDKDGSGHGYDCSLISAVTSRANIPVIALGGAGSASHMAEAALKGGCQAVAAANFFNHFEHSTIFIKDQLASLGLDIRRGEGLQYSAYIGDYTGRPIRKEAHREAL